MDGRRNQKVENEWPIAKPCLPLPMIFSPSKRSEQPTQRRPENGAATLERAHFYRQRSTESGAPVYGFYIATDGAERENPGPKH